MIEASAQPQPTCISHWLSIILPYPSNVVHNGSLDDTPGAIAGSPGEFARAGSTQLRQHEVYGLGCDLEHLGREESLEDPTWATFDCVVSQPDATRWLAENRPEIAAALPP